MKQIALCNQTLETQKFHEAGDANYAWRARIMYTAINLPSGLNRKRVQILMVMNISSTPKDSGGLQMTDHCNLYVYIAIG